MWKAWLSWRLPPGSKRWRSVRPEETGIGAQPGDSGELRVGGEALDAGDLADQCGGGDDTEPAFDEQLWRDLVNERGELGGELADRAGEVADPADLIASDPHPDRWLSALEPATDPLLPGRSHAAIWVGSPSRDRGRAVASAVR